jgi:ELWxxDGT repeat protein
LAARAETASLVADLGSNAELSTAVGWFPNQLVALGDKLIFVAGEPSSGAELWGSDGTPHGTALLRDICPGACSYQLRILGVAGAVAFVLAEGGRIDEIWRTDGTRAGTFRVAAIDVSLAAAAVTAGALFFTACEPATGCELWRSDGTVAGTGLVLDIYPGFWNGRPDDFVAWGGRVYFIATSELGVGIWRSDGTAAGTVPLRASFGFGNVALLAATSSRLFFVAPDDGLELWSTDGSPEGTRTVTSFAAVDPTFGAHEVSGDRLLFIVDDVVGGRDLWQSDGTRTGTRRRTDFGYSHPFDFDFTAENMEPVGNYMLFVADDGIDGERLWTNGGTPSSTHELSGCPDGCPLVDENTPLPLWTLGDRVLFFASDGDGTALWSSDGTGPGTRKVKALCGGDCMAFDPQVAVAGGRIYFITSLWDIGNHTQLWQSDGTTAATEVLLGLSSHPTGDASGFEAASTSRGVFFAADDDVHGSQIWKTDGATAEPVSALTRAPASSSPSDFVALGNDMLFVACGAPGVGLWASGGTAATTRALPGTLVHCSNDRPVHQLTVVGPLAFFTLGDLPLDANELWRTDGTAAGTFRIAALPPGSRVEIVAHQGALAVLVWNEDDGVTLWTSDGTAVGTRQLVDLGGTVVSATALTSTGSDLFFVGNADLSATNQQVWRSDGTPAGTVQLTSLTTAYALRDPPRFTRLGGSVYFLVGGALWRSGGTGATTEPVPPPSAGGAAANVDGLAVFQGNLYFFAYRDPQQYGQQRGVWRSDGTAAGTTFLAAVAPPRVYFADPPPQFAAEASALYFVGDDGEHGSELWKTDGTPAGTTLVRDVMPGAGGSSPTGLAVAGNRVFFAAHDGEHGVELWESDGTPTGTRMVQDLAPGAVSSHPAEMTAAGSRLFFAADDGVWGREPWTLTLGVQGCQPSQTALCLGDRYRVEAHWRDFEDRRGAGHAVALTADTGTFWFFDPANVEVILKVLDGRGVNGHVWVFYGALSSVEYTLTVTDTMTGAARRYVNPSGRLGSVADTDAFGPRGATPSAPSVVSPYASLAFAAIARHGKTTPSICVPSATRLCLNAGRFAVEARWSIPGNSGVGQAVPLSGDTGYLWFFGADNVELVIKVLDGRPLNGKFWVFYGALSDVSYTLTVTDTMTGAVREYANPGGRLASVADTGAF